MIPTVSPFPPKDPDLLDSTEAAIYIGVAPVTFTSRHRDWLAPRVRIAGRPYFHKSDLDEVILRRKAQNRLVRPDWTPHSPEAA